MHAAGEGLSCAEGQDELGDRDRGRRGWAVGGLKLAVWGCGRQGRGRGSCESQTLDPSPAVAARPGWGPMGTWASRGRPAPVPAPDPEPEEALDLSQLPPELLLVVLSHVPPRTLLGRCRRVCRGWRALVDGQALWLLILARDHGALLPLARSCLPPAREARPCLLGRFCERSPIGRNLIRNPCGQGEEPGEGSEGGGGTVRCRGLGLGGAAWVAGGKNWGRNPCLFNRRPPEVDGAARRRRLGGGGKQVNRAWGAFADLLRVFLQVNAPTHQGPGPG